MQKMAEWRGSAREERSSLREAEQLLVSRRWDEAIARSLEALRLLFDPTSSSSASSVLSSSASSSSSSSAAASARPALLLPVSSLPHMCGSERCPCVPLMAVLGQALFESRRGDEFLPLVFRVYGAHPAPFHILSMAARLEVALGRSDRAVDLLLAALDVRSNAALSTSQRAQLVELLAKCERPAKTSSSSSSPTVAAVAVASAVVPAASAAVAPSASRGSEWLKPSRVGVVLASLIGLLGMWRARKVIAKWVGDAFVLAFGSKQVYVPK